MQSIYRTSASIQAGSGPLGFSASLLCRQNNPYLVVDRILGPFQPYIHLPTPRFNLQSALDLQYNTVQFFPVSAWTWLTQQAKSLSHPLLKDECTKTPGLHHSSVSERTLPEHSKLCSWPHTFHTVENVASSHRVVPLYCLHQHLSNISNQFTSSKKKQTKTNQADKKP